MKRVTVILLSFKKADFWSSLKEWLLTRLVWIFTVRKIFKYEKFIIPSGITKPQIMINKQFVNSPTSLSRGTLTEHCVRPGMCSYSFQPRIGVKAVISACTQTQATAMIVLFLVNIFRFVGCTTPMYLWMLIAVSVKMDVSRKNTLRKPFNWHITLPKIHSRVTAVIIENGMHKSATKISVRLKLTMKMWVSVRRSSRRRYTTAITRKFPTIATNMIRHKTVASRIPIHVGSISLPEWDSLAAESLVLLLSMLSSHLST